MNFISAHLSVGLAEIRCAAQRFSRIPNRQTKETSILQLALKALLNLSKKTLFLFLDLIKLGQILLSSRPVRGRANKGNPPIVLIHGLFGNRDNWNLTCKRLLELGGDHLGTFYPISLPFGNRSLAQDVEMAVGIIKKITIDHAAQRVHLLGHSRGGLIALLCAHELNVQPQSPLISVVTLASPLKGCPLASFGGFFNFKDRCQPLKDLALKSEMVAAISKLSNLSHRKELKMRNLHLVAERDLLVPPANQSFELDDPSRCIPSGHMGVLVHQKSIAFLHRWLSQGLDENERERDLCPKDQKFREELDRA